MSRCFFFSVFKQFSAFQIKFNCLLAGSFDHTPPKAKTAFLQGEIDSGILEDPGAVSRVDKMFVVKVYCKIDLTVNFHHEYFIDPTNRPWVSEDETMAS